MRKAMLNERQSDRMDVGAWRSVRLIRSQQQVVERRPVMRAAIMRSGAAALLFLCVLVSYSVPAQAEPPDHPGNCPGEPPGCGGVGSKVICTNDGDWMCCHPNKDGGYDCEASGVKPTNPGGRVARPPLGPLQSVPISPPPKASTPKSPATGGTNRQ